MYVFACTVEGVQEETLYKKAVLSVAQVRWQVPCAAQVCYLLLGFASWKTGGPYSNVAFRCVLFASF